MMLTPDPPAPSAPSAPPDPDPTLGAPPVTPALVPPGEDPAQTQTLSCEDPAHSVSLSPGEDPAHSVALSPGEDPAHSVALSREDPARLASLSREERRRRRRATAKYRRAHATRERVRVEAFNAAFGELRGLLPTLPPDRRMAKIEILRLAICYISYLNHVLDI